jgi:hypothetical protein
VIPEDNYTAKSYSSAVEFQLDVSSAVRLTLGSHCHFLCVNTDYTMPVPAYCFQIPIAIMFFPPIPCAVLSSITICYSKAFLSCLYKLCYLQLNMPPICFPLVFCQSRPFVYTSGICKYSKFKQGSYVWLAKLEPCLASVSRVCAKWFQTFRVRETESLSLHCRSCELVIGRDHKDPTRSFLERWC